MPPRAVVRVLDAPGSVPALPPHFQRELIRLADAYVAAWSTYGSPRSEGDVFDIDGPTQLLTAPDGGPLDGAAAGAGADRAGAGSAAAAAVPPAARVLDEAAMALVDACYRALNCRVEGGDADLRGVPGAAGRAGAPAPTGTPRGGGEEAGDALLLGDGVPAESAGPGSPAAGGDVAAGTPFAPSMAYAFPREAVDALVLAARSAELHAAAAAPAAAAETLRELLRRAPPAWVAVAEGGKGGCGETTATDEAGAVDRGNRNDGSGTAVAKGGNQSSISGVAEYVGGGARGDAAGVSVTLFHNEGACHFPPFAPPSRVTALSCGLGAADSAGEALRLATAPRSASRRSDFLSPLRQFLIALNGAREVVSFAFQHGGDVSAESDASEGDEAPSSPARSPSRLRGASLGRREPRAGEKRTRRWRASHSADSPVRGSRAAEARFARLRAHPPFAEAAAAAAPRGSEGRESRGDDVVAMTSSPALYFAYLCDVLAADLSARLAAWRLSGAGDARPLLGSLLWRLWSDPGAGRDAQRLLVEGVACLLGDAAMEGGEFGADEGRDDDVGGPKRGLARGERDGDGDASDASAPHLPSAPLRVPLPLPEELVESAARLLFDLGTLLSALEASGAFDPRARLPASASPSSAAGLLVGRTTPASPGLSSAARGGRALRGAWGTPRSELDRILCGLLWGWQGAAPTSRPPPARGACPWPWAAASLVALPRPDRARLAAVCLADRYATALERGYVREEKRGGALEALGEALAASRHEGATPALDLAAIAAAVVTDVDWCLSPFGLALATSELIEVLLGLCVQGDAGNARSRWSVGVDAGPDGPGTDPTRPSPLPADALAALAAMLDAAAAWAVNSAENDGPEEDVVAGLVAARVGLGWSAGKNA